MIRKPIGTQHKLVTAFNRKRPFNVNLNKWIWPKTARNHVAWMKQFNILNGRSSQSDHFPLKAMVKRQLFDASATDSVNATVTNMPYDRSVFRKTQHAASCSHAFEFAILPTTIVDRLVRSKDGLPHAVRDGWSIALEVGMRQRINRNATG